MSELLLHLCDLAAEALILCDPGEPESVRDMTARFEELADAFGDIKEDHPAVAALVAARAVASGEVESLKALEGMFQAVRSAAEGSDESAPASKRPAKKRKRQPATAKAAVPQAADPGSATAVMPLAADAELMSDFVIRAGEHLDDADARLLDLERAPGDREAMDAVFRAFHTIKGMAGFLALDEISERSHDFEALLVEPRKNGTRVPADTLVELFSAVDEMRVLVARAGGEGAGQDVRPLSAEEPLQDAPEEDLPVAMVATGAGSAREGTVRIAEARLDVLLDTIGELVIAESMSSASVRQGSDQTQVISQLERLDKITRELQHMATSLRMIPLRATFGRMARLVRDLSHKAGKPIEFVMTGEDTELDKAVVDRIQDPLVHALRNAVDHGIESPAARKASGKPAQGRIELRAFHAGGSIHIEVEDDGGGIDRDAVIAKARKHGLLGPDETPSADQVLDLLFAPGFSTAKQVTDVSGRGVGMDAVRTAVKELRGRVDITSTAGSGTTISIRLPVTLAIIDGMVCRVGEERYIIPVLSIERSVRPGHDELTPVIGRGLMLSTAEGMLPVIPLHSLLGVSGAEADAEKAVVVIVSEGGMRAGLLVCELLGQQQTVIKPLGEGIPDQVGIAGGAIMPDGRVGLILDAAGLVRLANTRER